jgi:hypothetical protein
MWWRRLRAGESCTENPCRTISNIEQGDDQGTHQICQRFRLLSFLTDGSNALMANSGEIQMLAAGVKNGRTTRSISAANLYLALGSKHVNVIRSVNCDPGPDSLASVHNIMGSAPRKE